MEQAVKLVSDLAVDTARAVVESLAHNWIPLALAIGIAAVMKVHVQPTRLESLLSRRTHLSILGSVAAGAFTPLCACGTMAVVLGMLTATVPWAPIMAFLTSSPLMSPDGFVLLAGIIGLEFAVAVAAASVLIGLGSGYLTHLVETRTGFLKGQTRFAAPATALACACSSPSPALAPAPAAACGCGTGSAAAAALDPAATAVACCASSDGVALSVAGPGDAAAALSAAARAVRGSVERLRVPEMVRALREVGGAQILLSFSLFVGVGYLVNRFVPVSIVGALLGAKSSLAIPLAALVGLPLYVTTESSVPIIQALMKSGASGGAMLAFLITGPATSAWVVAGLTTFLRKRAIALYVALILVGGILSGYGYQLYLGLRP